MTFAAYSFSLASDSSTACFDITTDGANITHIFVASTPAASASEYAITVDGEPIEKLSTDESPCEDIPRDVWFPLHGNQDTAHVCVTVHKPRHDVRYAGVHLSRPYPINVVSLSNKAA